MEDKISIIVPVYNVEAYIERCIDSLINQTYKNLEIILVNDGSKDNSQSICEKYIKLDPRLILINQKNGGSSIARNTGLERATGTIISFIDSDDFIDKSMYEQMMRRMNENNLDVVEIAHIETNEIKNFDNEFTVENPVTASERILKNALFSVWRRIYKRELVKGMRFIPNIIHQDVFFTIDVLNKINAVGYLNSALYHYNTENESVIRSKYTNHKIEIGIRATEYISSNAIDNSSLNKVVDNYVAHYYTDHYFLLSRNTHVDLDLGFRKKLRKRIKNTSRLDNLTLRSLMVILLPIKIMEIISSTGVILKKYIK